MAVSMVIRPGSVSTTDLIWPFQAELAFAVVKSEVLSCPPDEVGIDSGAAAVWLTVAPSLPAVARFGEDEQPAINRAADNMARV